MTDTPTEPEALAAQLTKALVDRDEMHFKTVAFVNRHAIIAALSTPAARMPAGEVAQDLRSALEGAKRDFETVALATESGYSAHARAAIDAIDAALAQPAENAKAGEVVADETLRFAQQIVGISNSLQGRDALDSEFVSVKLIRAVAGVVNGEAFRRMGLPPAAEPVGLREAAQSVLDNADRPGSRMCFGGGPDGDDIWIDHKEVDQSALDQLSAALAAPARTDDAGVGPSIQIIGGPCAHRWSAMTMTGQMSCVDCRQTRPMTATEVAQWTK